MCHTISSGIYAAYIFVNSSRGGRYGCSYKWNHRGSDRKILIFRINAHNGQWHSALVSEIALRRSARSACSHYRSKSWFVYERSFPLMFKRNDERKPGLIANLQVQVSTYWTSHKNVVWTFWRCAFSYSFWYECWSWNSIKLHPACFSKLSKSFILYRCRGGIVSKWLKRDKLPLVESGSRKTAVRRIQAIAFDIMSAGYLNACETEFV